MTALDRVVALVFDLGETLVDETVWFERWAARLGVPMLTLSAVLGGYVERRQPFEDALRHFEPTLDVRAVAGELATDGGFTAADLYPDVLPCLNALRDKGMRLGIAGNQPRAVEQFSRTLPVDVVGSSGSWGARKPDPAFFAALVEAVGVEPERIAYVGDRVDNDVVPAADAGLVAVHVRRGPWGHLQASWPEAGRAAARIDSLAELPGLVGTT